MKVSLTEAKKIIDRHVSRPNTIYIDFMDALGYTLAKPVYAEIDQPPFRRSCVDGYAVRSCDAHPGTLKVSREIDAGCTDSYSLSAGHAIRIMTGAPVSDEIDVVIPQEMTDYGEGTVTLFSCPERTNIAPIGEDFHKGELLLPADSTITAGAVACLAAAGITSVCVYSKRKIGIISTGDELIPPGSPLKTGQIYDSNLPYLLCRIQEKGCNVSFYRHTSDDTNIIKEALSDAFSCSDMVITTGGVSVGKKDLMEESICSCGGSVLFHGIDIKPGMPTMFSLINDIPVLSLSGNPFSAGSIFEYLFPEPNAIYTHAPLSSPYTSPRNEDRIVRGFWDGTTIHLFEKQRNGSTKESAAANCLVLLPTGMEPIDMNRLLPVKLIR